MICKYFIPLSFSLEHSFFLCHLDPLSEVSLNRSLLRTSKYFHCFLPTLETFFELAPGFELLASNRALTNSDWSETVLS